jgi:hypothetical protein
MAYIVRTVPTLSHIRLGKGHMRCCTIDKQHHVVDFLYLVQYSRIGNNKSATVQKWIQEKVDKIMNDAKGGSDVFKYSLKLFLMKKSCKTSRADPMCSSIVYVVFDEKKVGNCF